MVSVSGFPAIDSAFAFPDVRNLGLIVGLQTPTARLPNSDAAVQLIEELSTALTTLQNTIATANQSLADIATARAGLEANVASLTSLRDNELTALDNARLLQDAAAFDTARTAFSLAAANVVITRNTEISDLGALDDQIEAVQAIINGTGGIVPDSQSLFTLAARGTGEVDPASLPSLTVLIDPTNAASVTESATTQGVLTINDIAPGDAVADNANATAAAAPTRVIDAFGPGADGLGFDGVNSLLTIANSAEINTVASTQRTAIIAFEAGSNVTRTQVLYEEGGGTHSLAFSIANGEFTASLVTNTGAPPADDEVFASVAIEPGQQAIGSIVFDGTTFTASVRVAGGNVDSFSTAAEVPNVFPAHGGGIGLGGPNGDVRLPNGVVAVANARFEGTIGQFTQFSTALSQTDLAGVENFIANQLNITITDPGTAIDTAETVIDGAIAAFNAEIATLNANEAALTAQIQTFETLATALRNATSTSSSDISALVLQLQYPNLFGRFGRALLENLTA